MATADEPDALFTAFLAGEPAALGALLEHCRPSLLAFVNKRLPPYLRTQVAEELVQDALAVAVPKMPGLRWPNLRAFYAWLEAFVAYRVVDWWEWITRLKRDDRRVLNEGCLDGHGDSGPALLDGAKADYETPSKLLQRREREDALYAALDGPSVTPKQRTALYLRFIEGLPTPAVAALLECTPDYVRLLCFRGMKALREALGSASRYFSSR